MRDKRWPFVSDLAHALLASCMAQVHILTALFFDAATLADEMGIEQPAAPPPTELFYTEGPPELKAARLEVSG
jgi:hypothetical protein